MSNYLVVDTETDGYYKDFEEPFTNIDNWPEIRQLAYIIADENGHELLNRNYTIENVDEKKIIFDTLLKDLKEYKPTVIGHNIDYDANVIGAELVRIGYYNYMLDCELICTMSSTVSYCNLENFKWPRLQELHQRIFGKPFEGAHEAYNDAKATSACFYHLKNEGFEFQKYKHSISSHSSYEKEILDKRKEHLKICFKACALVELLRLFRLSKQKLSVEGELNLYSNNFYKYTIEKSNSDYFDDQNLSELQKQFYLENEASIKPKLGLDKLWENEKPEVKEKLKELPIGGDLFAYCLINNYSTDLENIKEIAKEFSSYLFLYELHLRAWTRKYQNKTENNMDISREDLIDSIKSKIANDQITIHQTVDWLASIFHPDIYNLSNVPPENLSGRKQAIEQDIRKVKEILEVSKPKIKNMQEATYFVAFLSNFYAALPDDLKSQTSTFRSYFDEYFGKKDKCYIATLVYGSQNHPKVVTLRYYRDLKLYKSLLGKLSIKIYYLISPLAVRFLQDKPLLNRMIRLFLDKFIRKIVKK